MLDTTIRTGDFRLALAAYWRARGHVARRYAAQHISYCLHQLGGMAGEW